MPTKNAVTKKDRQPRTSEDWVVSKHKRFRANIIVWGMPKDLTTLEIRAKLADLGLASFVIKIGGMCFGRETMLD